MPAEDQKSDQPALPFKGKTALVLVATSTKEKVDQLNAAAKELGLNTRFVQLTDFVDVFHAAPEDQSGRAENAKQKTSYIRNVIDGCREDNSMRDKLKDFCIKLDIPFNPDNIFFATDDTTLNLPKPVWKLLRSKLRRSVTKGLLLTADRMVRDGVGTGGSDKYPLAGPGSETGPIWAAALLPKFFEAAHWALVQAKNSKTYDDDVLPITTLSTFVVTRLSDPSSAPDLVIEAESKVQLYMPYGLEKPCEPPNKELFCAEDFCSLPKDPTRRITDPDPAHKGSDPWIRFLAQESVRGAVVKALQSHLREVDGANIRQHMRLAAKMSAKDLRDRIVNVTGSNLKLPTHSTKRAPQRGYLNEAELLSLAPSFHRADAFVFPPFDATNVRERLRMNYDFFSAIVAKQMEAQYRDCPIVVIDDGCWAPTINVALDLCRSGMMKNFLTEPYDGRRIVTVNGIRHLGTHFFDVVGGNDSRARRQAADQVLKFRFKNFRRFSGHSYLKSNFLSGGQPPDPNLFTVAGYTSASNDNLVLHNFNYHVGDYCARKGLGLSWGGSDQHGMGAFYKGYLQNGGKHLYAYTTDLIVAQESKFGCIPPGCMYWELDKDIYQRQDNMGKPADTFCISPGGPGTFQELAGVLLQKEFFPQYSAEKSVIIGDIRLHRGANPFFGDYLRLLLGRKFYDSMASNHLAHASQGVLLATSKEEAAGHIGRIYKSSRKFGYTPQPA